MPESDFNGRVIEDGVVFGGQLRVARCVCGGDVAVSEGTNVYRLCGSMICCSCERLWQFVVCGGKLFGRLVHDEDYESPWNYAGKTYEREEE